MRFLARLAPLLFVLAGCGGGGGGFSRNSNPYEGSYVGTFTETTTGTLPSSTGFAPPTSGISTATIDTAGNLSVIVGTNYFILGTVNTIGAVANGHLNFRSTVAGDDTSPTATVTLNKLNGTLTITANAAIGTTAAASYAVTLTEN